MASRISYPDQVLAANGRKFLITGAGNIAATTTSGATAITADAIGNLPPGQLVCIQATDGDCYYELGGSSVAATTSSMLLKSGYQEFVYLWAGSNGIAADSYIALKAASGTVHVSVFAVR